MLKELRKLPKSKSNHLRILQHRGKIGVYFSEKGFLSYDTDEYKNYKKNAKIGRPAKLVATNKGENKNE